MPAHSSDQRKDLRDFKGLSRQPIVAYLQKQSLPPASRRKPAPAAGIFQQLRRYRTQAEQLSEFLERPVLWFWGHEHRLAIYPMFRSGRGIAAFGRCIGHGGMPVDLPPSRVINPDCAVEFLDHRKYPNNEGLNVGYNGFARLTFRRETLAVEYVDLEGTVLFQESWSVGGDGGLQRTAAAAMITLPTTGEGAPGSGAVAAGRSTQ